MDAWFGALMIGMFTGFVPLFVGVGRQRSDLGWAAFAVCVFAGLLLGALLAVPAAVVATFAVSSARRGGQTRVRAHREENDRE